MSISTHVYFIEMRPPHPVVQSSHVKNVVQHLHIIRYVIRINNINVVLVILSWIYTNQIWCYCLGYIQKHIRT